MKREQVREVKSVSESTLSRLDRMVGPFPEIGDATNYLQSWADAYPTSTVVEYARIWPLSPPEDFS